MSDLTILEGKKRCRSCGEWLDPVYGAMRTPTASLVSPSAVKALAEAASGDTSSHYFECYTCEAKRKRKSRILYTVFLALVVLVLVKEYLPKLIPGIW